MKKLLLILLCVPLMTLSQQTGCIKWDCENGYGTYNYVNGDKYVGEWKDNKKYGLGTYTWENPWEQYVGYSKDNMMHGQGTYTYANGYVKKGLCKEGDFLGE